MQIPVNYYFMKRDYLKKKKDYKNLDIEEKIEFMKLELKLNGINIKEQRLHTKAETKALKKEMARRRK